MKKQEREELTARLRFLVLDKMLHWENKTLLEKVAMKLEIIQLSKKLKIKVYQDY